MLLSVILLLIASYTSSMHAWWENRQEIQTLKAQKAQYGDDIAKLNDTKRRFDDPAFVRQQARERFGWVLPGETGYRVIGADGQVQGDVPTLDEPPSPAAKPWYESLWGSVQEAGREPEATPTPTPTPSDDVLKEQ